MSASEAAPGPIGVDGCPVGWVAVSRHTAWTNKSLGALLDCSKPKIVALDMPVGLPEHGPRACDIAARRVLGPRRGTSVFAVPMRATLAATRHAEAGDLNAAACGKRISAQTYNLLAKIKEVDGLLRASAYWRARLFETHPEVSFAALNANTPIAQPKRSEPGRAKRQALIDSAFGAGAFARARAAIAKHKAADDDIADAFACLFTAERIACRQHRTLPPAPPQDSQGLPMRICY